VKHKTNRKERKREGENRIGEENRRGGAKENKTKQEFLLS
jgi:hypothetical protein